ncbi:MAG TPA: hypothetical protein VMT63_04715 [Bacteroidales bacterium]|nr:hypothetical protein [Bacteroidales bacterium]
MAGQEKSPPEHSFPSMKSANLYAGLIGLGFGYGGCIEYSSGKFVVSASVGYKQTGVRDSSLVINGHRYDRIVTGDGKGLVYSAGIGYLIKSEGSSEQRFIAESSTIEQHYSYSVIRSWGHNRNVPFIKATYIMLQVFSWQTGKFVNIYPGTGQKVYVFIPGSNIYLSPGMRFIKEDVGQRRTMITDGALVLAPEMGQVGASWNTALINGPFNFAIGFSMIRRLDRPSQVDNPFGSDTKYRWVFPFRVTFGISFSGRGKHHSS